jgi:hypothetical protein
MMAAHTTAKPAPTERPTAIHFFNKVRSICSLREHLAIAQTGSGARLLCSISPFSTPTGLGHEALDCQLDVLWHAWQEAAFVPRDGVSGHAESVSEFALSEPEEEPLLTKLPTGQAGLGYLREQDPSISDIVEFTIFGLRPARLQVPCRWAPTRCGHRATRPRH